jgi:hypothetical protein
VIITSATPVYLAEIEPVPAGPQNLITDMYNWDIAKTVSQPDGGVESEDAGQFA